ncbi:MAG: GDSL-type esterase/lipase family protein [Bacteroidota bacterium]
MIGAKFKILIGFLGILFPILFLSAQPSPCSGLTPYHIVVMGSSTAAGAGASTSDSAWVNRYRRHLQEINPASTLTNIARGGYNTYHLMPSGFVPPVGKPAPDTTRNITRALSLQPDAIIINLPSNDAGSGNPPAVQLANFDSMLAVANQAGVPVWICTTQPRNFGNSGTVQIQLDTRDSILVRYVPRVLDFWTGLEDSLITGWIDPAFDSGDGVHLNDVGHALLNQRAIAVDVPGQLFVAPEVPDLALVKADEFVPDLCGDSLQWVPIWLQNLGAPAPPQLTLSIAGVAPDGTPFSQSLSLAQTPGTCETDTIGFWLDTRLGGMYNLEIWHNGQDYFAGNDSLTLSFEVIGTPQPRLVDATICAGDSLLLFAETDLGDQVRWYDDAIGDSLLGEGPMLLVGPLDSSRQVFAQTIRDGGDFTDSLAASDVSGIHWNGFMFDLIATETLTLDSLAIRIFDPGAQVVEMRLKDSSYQGHELSPGAWSLHATDSVQVDASDEWVMLHFPAIDLLAGDTMGVYLQLSDPSARLSYEWSNQPTTFSTSELTLWSGSGISHDFGAIYFPRHINARLFYHFENPTDCVSEFFPVNLLIQEAPDASFTGEFQGDTLWLTPPANPGATTLWDFGQGPEDLGDSAVYVFPPADSLFEVHLLVSNACGADSSTQSFLLNTLSLDASEATFSVGPNPFDKHLRVQGKGNGRLQLELWDLQGRKVQSTNQQVFGAWEVDWEVGNQQAGGYVIRMLLNGTHVVKKVVKVGG